ncbi:MAG: amidohydrolase family protein [Candidatus Latescibacterota bacterium]
MSEYRESVFLKHAEAGETLEGVRVVDGHCHMGPYFAFYIPENTVEGMIRVMDRVGIDTIIASPHVAIGPDFQMGNDMVADAMRRYPGRVLGYAFLNPRHQDGVLEELERCVSLGMRQIKLHSCNGYPYDGERYRPGYELANQRGFPILAHTWGKDAEVFDSLAEAYPNISFILAHAGVVDFNTYVKLAAGHPNIYLDQATSQVGYGWIERFVEEVGAEKILFGSDMPFLSEAQQIGKVLYARISDADKRKILGENARRIFGLE